MTKKRLLILNGSHSDIPLIQAGHKLGFHVITAGNDPDLIGHSYADEYCCIDFSDKQKVLELSLKLNIDAICSCANDFGIITASYVAEKLNIPGHDPFETTYKLHHKDTFREITKKLNMHSPIAKSFHSIEEAIQNISSVKYPAIVKPVDLTGGKGVSRVDNDEAYKTAVKKAFQMTRSNIIVVEPFLIGTMHSFSTFIVNQKIVAYFSDNEYAYKNPYLISSSAGPATNIELVENILITDLEKLARELNLVDGILHAQYIMSDGMPNIIEVTRRCSGDFYSIPVEYARDIPWSEMMVRAECGMPIEVQPMHKPQRYGGRHCIMGDHNGTIKDVIFSDEIKDNIYDKFLWWKPGYKIDDYLKDKLGVLFLKFSSEEEMIDKINRITDLVKVVYEESEGRKDLMPHKMNIIKKLRQPFVVAHLQNEQWKHNPLVVELDTTEVCNFACPGCISEDLVSNSTSFSTDRLMSLAQELYDFGVKAVILIGGGEPLAHPAVGELIKFFGTHDIKVGITTNGYFIPKYLDEIAEYATWTRVSMDAATPETFLKLRPTKDGKSTFNHILDGMQSLSKVKKGNLGFSFLIRTEADGFGIESNISEIYDAAVIARDVGCDYIEIKPSYNYKGGGYSLISPSFAEGYGLC